MQFLMGSKREWCSTDPLLFAREYLPDHVEVVFGSHHRDIATRIKGAETGKRYVWAAPRGHAKSTLVSLVVPLWWLAYGLKKYIILVADTSHQAESFLQAIITEIEENEALKKDFPHLKPALDQKGQLVAWRDRGITLLDATVEAYGAGKAIRGARKKQFRPDAVIVDDLENDSHVNTKEQRDKLDSWFLRALLNLGDVNTDFLMVGTVIHHDSVLARRLNDPAWEAKVWKAFSDNGTALWPAKWPVEALESKRKEIGSIAFAAEFQNDPTAMGAGIFKDGWLQYYTAAPPDLSIYAGVDLAISKRDTADRTAIVKVGLAGDKIYVLDTIADRWSFREAEQEIIGRCHNTALTGIESTAYQVAMAEEIMRDSIVPVREIHPHKDKVTRATTLSAYIEAGKILFDRYRHGELIRELLDFPMGAHDDLVDALGYAVSLAMEAASYSEGITTRGMAMTYEGY